MAPVLTWPPRASGSPTTTTTTITHGAPSRPMPLRIRTFSDTKHRSTAFKDRHGSHARNKSVACTVDNALLLCPVSPRSLANMVVEEDEDEDQRDPSPRSSIDGSRTSSSVFESTRAASPDTPLTGQSPRSSLDVEPCEIIPFDFSSIDYELERARVLGEGLWSTVYLAEQKSSQPSPSFKACRPSRSVRRPRTPSAPLLFAVKTPSRPDAKDVFRQEARVLTHLQRKSTSGSYIIPFYGLDARNESLVFEAVIGGSLEDLSGRLKQMTEVARHIELINLFPGVASDLIAGLDFLHANHIIHADIKPANILLDIQEHATLHEPVIRARYIDFSAAFRSDHGPDPSNAGGTWDFMAPEQMRVQKDLSTPTYASDVWSLGITLLYIMAGASPYHAACQGNHFMLREAIKTGDPIGFARGDPVPRKRLAACQDFVDCCRLALKKDRENRITAGSWTMWLQECDWAPSV